MQKDNYVTEEGLQKLKTELENLKQKRKEISLRIQEAKELGDLSENAEYHEAKNDQAFTEGRIVEIEALLHTAKVIDKPKKNSDLVQIGSQIVVENGGEEVHYTIVGSNEANPIKGFISNESPLGRTFLGKRIGDSCVVKAPKGDITYRIIKIH